MSRLTCRKELFTVVGVSLMLLFVNVAAVRGAVTPAAGAYDDNCALSFAWAE